MFFSLSVLLSRSPELERHGHLGTFFSGYMDAVQADRQRAILDYNGEQELLPVIGVLLDDKLSKLRRRTRAPCR